MEQIRRSWYVTPIACGVAVIIATGVSLLLPKKYTATAQILIEPPAGSDQRTFVAVSPIYLESLKTYERMAASDSLFLGALERFHLRGPGDNRAIESWKRSVLKVEIPRNTKVLEISATLPDPKMAQALALYLAQQTVKTSREVGRRSGEDLTADAEAQYREARAEMERAEEAWAGHEKQQPVEALEDRAYSFALLRREAERDLTAAEQDASEDAERRKSMNSDSGSPPELAIAQARVRMLRERISGLDRESSRLAATLAERHARRDSLDARRKSAEDAFALAETHLREVRNSLGYTGERLNIIDPGIAPERPSSPNIILNVLAAFLLGLIASALYMLAQVSLGSHSRDVQRYQVTHDA